MGDEPTGNLDSKNTGIVFDLFQKLAKDFGQTIITVTHDEDFARRSDRIIEMADGEIKSHGKWVFWWIVELKKTNQQNKINQRYLPG